MPPSRLHLLWRSISFTRSSSKNRSCKALSGALGIFGPGPICARKSPLNKLAAKYHQYAAGPNWWHTRKMSVSDVPGALLWPAAMIFWGPQFTCSRHIHHSIQLILALERSLRIRGGAEQEWISCGAVLVRADAPHEVEGGGVPSLFVFVDPESDLGTTLSEKITASIQPIDATTIELWRTALGDPATLAADRVNPWIRDCLLSGRRMPKLHPKVRLVLKVLRDELSSRRKFPLRSLADLAGLSPSRSCVVDQPSAWRQWPSRGCSSAVF